MTSFADLTVMQHFSGVFVFFFVFILTYAFLQFTKIFDKTEGAKGVYAFLALVVAFITSLSNSFFDVITSMVPWFIVLIVFVFLIMFVSKMFTGGEEGDMFKDLLMKNKTVIWTLVAIFAVIALVSIIPSVNNNDVPSTPETTTTQSGATVVTTDANGTSTVVVHRDDVYSGRQEQPETPQRKNTLGDDIVQTIIHPQMLGVLLLLIIAGFSVLLLTQSPKI